jgi:hypothetical protein
MWGRRGDGWKLEDETADPSVAAFALISEQRFNVTVIELLSTPNSLGAGDHLHQQLLPV